MACKPTSAASFWARVRPTDTCWLWTGGLNTHGYGQVRYQGRQMNASRLAVILIVGEIPAGALVLHRCDNPQCVNPDHLYLGDGAQNAADRVSRGRSLKGAASPKAKLTNDDVREIRQRRQAGELYAAIAADFAITPENAAQICRRETWRHI